MSHEGMQFGLLRSLSGCEWVFGGVTKECSRVPGRLAPSGAL